MANTVRLAGERDIPALLELLKQVNRIHHEGRPDLFNLKTKYTADELRGILKDDRTPVFVCEDGQGRVVGEGFCVLQRPRNTELFTDILTLYIDDLCVDESARHQHVGTDLYSYIAAYARRKGCHNITVNVWSCNPEAMAYYTSLGMVPYKTGMEMVLEK